MGEPPSERGGVEDARLNEALAEQGLADPRDLYRSLLRRLRSTDERAYDAAVEHYRTELLPELEEASSDPVAAWLRYGVDVARRLEAGRPVAVDGTGLARPFDPGETLPAGPLLLYLPEGRSSAALLLAAPAEPSEPQLATMELLCR